MASASGQNASPMASSASASWVAQSSNASLSIRQEIQRFESVHPSIYAIYDLIELVNDPLLAQQIREHVVCIEDSFVNSQEWTLARPVPDLRLGIVGSMSSGKSALVHRYLTGSYMQEESPEGGRFKKEIVIDSQSFLLLIRDEGGPPEMQFTSWVDAVIFVFSLENETSFNAIYNYYAKMSKYRNMQDIPIILVGTQDFISENHPRLIDEARARKLALDLKKSSYYETCATYGLNVERVFQDACYKITQSRHYSRPATPTQSQSQTALMGRPFSSSFLPSPSTNSPVAAPYSPGGYANLQGTSSGSAEFVTSFGNRSGSSTGLDSRFFAPPERSAPDGKDIKDGLHAPAPNQQQQQLPTPSSTPTSARKNRRRSNLFTPSKKLDDEKQSAGTNAGLNAANGQTQLGSGRSIPIRQGYLYKKSNTSFSKEWKKKYVTLCDDGKITYHSSLHDYMENTHGKEISLQYVTVKVPGQKPRGSRTVPSNNNDTTGSGMAPSQSTSQIRGVDKKGEKVLLTSYEVIREPTVSDDGEQALALAAQNEKAEAKKRHRRIKSNGMKANQEGEDADMFEFHIVSLDNKQWLFEAGSAEEREDWVEAIEQQILNSLQGIKISKSRSGQPNQVHNSQAIKTIKSDIPGNNRCVDCDAANPDWASLNLGVLMCIECSGVHRQLGSHISRVRSLDLDEWPPGHIAVMAALGNKLANTVFEGKLAAAGVKKPEPNSPQNEKERFIQAKYQYKQLVSPLPAGGPGPAACLIDGICRSDMRLVLLALAHASSDDVNTVISSRDARTPLHLAASLGNMAVVQLLIWANANVKSYDREGRSSASYARHSGNQELLELLLNNGCPDSNDVIPRKNSNGALAQKDILEKVTSSVL